MLKKVTKITLLTIALSSLVVLLTLKGTKTLKKLIENKVKKQALNLGLNISTVSISEIGLTHAIITNLKIKNSVEIPLIKIEYSLSDLIKKGDVEKISISGLKLNTTLTDENKFVVKGFENIQKSTNSKVNSDSNKIPKIILKSCAVILTARKQTFTIPFDFHLTNSDSGFSVYLKTHTNFFEGEVKGTLSDFANGNLSLKLEKIYNQFFIDKLLNNKNITLNGLTTLKGKIVLKNGKLNNSILTVNGENHNLNFNNRLYINNFSFKATANISDGFQLSDFKLIGNFQKCNLQNSITLTQGEVQLNGNSIKHILFALKADFPIKLQLFLNGEINNLQSNLEIKSNITANLQKGVFNIKDNKISIEKPMTTKGEFVYNNNKINGTINLNLPTSFMLQEKTIKSKTLKGKLKIKGNINKLQTLLTLTGKNIKVKSKELKHFKCKLLKINSSVILEHQQLKSIGGIFKVKNLNLTTTDNIEIENCQMELPFSKNTIKNGFFNVKKITTTDIYLTNIKGQLSLTNQNKIAFKGSGLLPVPPLVLQFNGNITPTKENVIFAKFSIPETKLSTYTSFSKLSPDLDNLLLKGVITLNGNASVNTLFNVKSSAILTLNNMFIKDTKETFSIEKLNTQIKFQDFINFKSKPSQTLTFESAGNQTIKVQNGLVLFSVINDTSVLIEKTKFNFCKGSIFTSGFFLSPENTDLQVDVYCQKLSLPSLLNTALGEEKAKGSGTVTGIIPIKVTDGNIFFEKSFLHSVPGETGHLQIEDGKDLTGGVILAEEAIKNFEYKWARIDFETNNNNLNLILRLDGKPSDKLPLVYDDKTGDFVKAPNNGKHVELQGLKLDLKFIDIDINRLLKEQKRLNISGN
jgi:hypothetical protein